MTTIDSDQPVLTQLRLATAAIVLALAFGALSVLYYLPPVATAFESVGLTLTSLRPLHTTFAHVWIYAANVALLYHFLAKQRPGGLDASDRRRFYFHTVCWLASAVGVLVTLLLGVTSGREYLGFHPALSLPLLAGWIAFAWTFFKYVAKGFWSRPVYVYMWSIGILYFIYTFVEAHAYLVPLVNRYPLVDLQLQWKSTGTLVGSFNFLVYGSMMYVGERLSGDDSYAQSRICFWLFGVSALNSFTNFAHHTYHVPQSHVVKWIAFIVSMLEIILVFRVLSDIVKRIGARSAGQHDTATSFLNSARWWTLAMVLGGVIISVPSWNSLIHGTHVVVAHAMGAELGIDSMILFGVVTYLLVTFSGTSEGVVDRLDGARMRGIIVTLNASMAILVTSLALFGTYRGILRYYGRPDPAWLVTGYAVFAGAGLLLTFAIIRLLVRWSPWVLGRFRS